MARTVRTVVDVSDDITGEIDAAATTIDFAYRGVAYEIDLGPENAQLMDNALEQFIGAARRVRGKATKASGIKRPRSDESRRIREWARTKGMSVSPRGRIDGEVVAAYHAHNSAAAADGTA